MDLDADGFDDIVTGQYHPGVITWFRGSSSEFLPGAPLVEEGDSSSTKNNLPSSDPRSFSYWIYSSPTFGDLDGDGDLDLVVGGGGGLRVNYNVGSTTRPKFGRRELLRTPDGDPLMVRTHSNEEIARVEAMEPSEWNYPELNPAGDFKTAPLLVDWDRDGVLDLLVGDSNAFPNSLGVAFFRGQGDATFAPGISLLSADNKSGKWLPGDGPRVFPTDWNNDGVTDLLIGLGVPTLNDGEFSTELAWTHSSAMNVQSPGKAPGRNPEYHDQMRHQISEQPQLAEFFGEERFWTLDYHGYVYVFLGSDDGSVASTLSSGHVQAEDPGRRAGDSELDQSAKEPGRESNGPVTATLLAPTNIGTGNEFEISIAFDMQPPWHIAGPTGNKKGSATTIDLSLSDGIEPVGDWNWPAANHIGADLGYQGSGILVTRTLRVADDAAAGSRDLTCAITYQACDPMVCLPPARVTVTRTVHVNEKGDR